MNEVLVLQHVPHEALGSLEWYFRRAGIPYRYVPIFRGVPARLELDRAAGLVVLGGPMNVDQIQQYPFLRHEVQWIQQAMARQLPVLGICLGAQLLAKSLGARVFANPVKEIGWYEIELQPPAATDPLFHECHARQTVFQWHGDTFDLPAGAVHLAESPLCRHQAFRYGDSAYGLQFHVEMTAELVHDWLEEAHNRCELAGLDYIDPQLIRRQTPQMLPRMQQLADQIVPRFAAMCTSAQAAHGEGGRLRQGR